MLKLPTIRPLSDLQQQSPDVLRQLRDSSGPVVLTENGRASAVLMSVESYERVAREFEMLLALAQGEQEIHNSEGFDAETVFAEAAALIKQDS